jgi:hypothetical protein
MINSRSAGLRWLGRKPWLEPLPWHMGEISSVHPDQYHDLNRVCTHDLVDKIQSGGPNVWRTVKSLYHPLLGQAVAFIKTSDEEPRLARRLRQIGCPRRAHPSAQAYTNVPRRKLPA